MRNVLNIDLRKIVVPEGRLRPVSAARVEELQDSIQKGQLLQPLVVGVPNAHKQWPLVDGAHRLAALKKLKYGIVPCVALKDNKYERRLAEIEANLVRSPLTRLQIHRHEAEARHLRDAIYGPTKRGGDRGNQYTGGKVAKRHGDVFPESDSPAAQTESTEARKRSVQRSVRLCKLLSAEECDRLEGTSVENCDKDLFAIAGIRDIRKRTAVISALSDAENPAPSLHEAKCRAGLAPHLEHDLEKEFEQGANRLFDSLFYGKRGALERFLHKVADQQPEFVEILSEMVKRLTERGGES